MPSAENSTACRFHKEIDQGTQNALAFCPPKVSDAVSLTAYLLYQTVFHLSRTFSKLFSKFLKQIFQKSNFSDRRLFRNSLFSISNSKPFVKNFFRSFQIFSVRPPRLSATALIEYHSTPPPVNKNFQVFSNSEIAILHPLRAKSENQFCLCGRHPADHRHGQYQCRNRIYHSRVFLYSPKHYQNLIHK